jgi:hypothetical protein
VTGERFQCGLIGVISLRGGGWGTGRIVGRGGIGVEMVWECGDIEESRIRWHGVKTMTKGIFFLDCFSDRTVIADSGCGYDGGRFFVGMEAKDVIGSE